MQQTDELEREAFYDGEHLEPEYIDCEIEFDDLYVPGGYAR